MQQIFHFRQKWEGAKKFRPMPFQPPQIQPLQLTSNQLIKVTQRIYIQSLLNVIFNIRFDHKGVLVT